MSTSLLTYGNITEGTKEVCVGLGLAECFSLCLKLASVLDMMCQRKYKEISRNSYLQLFYGRQMKVSDFMLLCYFAAGKL